MGPTALLPLRRKACWGFFRPKNPKALAGCEPANLGTKGQHATSRPPKPLRLTLHYFQTWQIFLNVVLEKNSEVQFDRSCEKLRTTKKSQEEYPANNQVKEV